MSEQRKAAIVRRWAQALANGVRGTSRPEVEVVTMGQIAAEITERDETRLGEQSDPDQFVLDRTENPHPLMLSEALKARTKAMQGGRTAYFFWRGYLAAMADATGERAEDIERWMDRNAPSPPESLSTGGRTPVAVPVRRNRPEDQASDETGA